jgi:hypothetical protein
MKLLLGLFALAILGCSNNPPILSTIQQSYHGTYGFSYTIDGRVTGPMTYRIQDTTWLGADTAIMEHIKPEIGGHITLSKKWKYFAVGGGLANLTLLIHGSFIYSDQFSITPYFVLGAYQSIIPLPGLLVGYTPIKYLGFSFARYVDYNYQVVSQSDLAPRIPKFFQMGHYWVNDGSLIISIPIPFRRETYPVSIGVKHQAGTKQNTYYLSLARTGEFL